MVDFLDSGELQKWLKGKPKEWTKIIAAQASARRLPLISNYFSAVNLDKKIQLDLVLSVFRANFISRAAIKYPGWNLHNATFSAAFAISTASAKSFTGSLGKMYDSASSATIAAVFALSPLSAMKTSLPISAAFTATDANSLIAGKSPVAILQGQLWPEKTKSPFLEKYIELHFSLTKLDPNWRFWTEWYQTILDGTSYPGLSQPQQDTLYRKIAMFPNELWDQGSEVVNAAIAELLEAVKDPQPTYDFFLSYSTQDEAIAKKISTIIEAEGYSVFAQFKDMPVGSNFITEMQNGLENSSRFICLYSSSYWTSDYCQQEWSAAITYDPRGILRKIIPFLIEEIALPPLAKAVIYKNIIGLKEEKFRKAVIEAISDPKSATVEKAREIAKDTISPQPFYDEDDKLDIRNNPEYDIQRVTDDLLEMPDIQSNLITSLLAHCEKSNMVPPVVKTALQQYKDEMVKNNFQARVTILDNQVNFIAISMKAEDSKIWLDEILESGLSTLLSNHSKIKTHFPLDPIREENFRDAPVDSSILDDQGFIRKNDQFKTLASALEKEGAATRRFEEYLKQQNDHLIELLSINASSIIKSDEDAVIKSEQELDLDDIKRRHLIQKSGFIDRISEVLSKSDKLASSPTLKSFAKISKELADWIWS